MAQNIPLYDWSVMPYQQAGRQLALGADFDPRSLEPDYWRWAIPWYLAKEKGINMRRWFARWLDDEIGSESEKSMAGSLNHQMCRQVGRLACAELGILDRRFSTVDAFRENQKKIVLAILRGEGWVATWIDPLSIDPDHGERLPWGLCAEPTRSRHYGARNWEFILALADLTDDAEIREEACRQMDAALEILRKGVRSDGLWDECLLPPARTHSDHCFFEEGTDRFCPDGVKIDIGCGSSTLLKEPDDHDFIELLKKFDLTRDPDDTPVLSYLLLGRPWRPEFQGTRQSKLQQWLAYAYIAGRVWRPLN